MGDSRMPRNEARFKRHDGRLCPYCQRAMSVEAEAFWLNPTRDHHPIPKSKGGQVTIIVCRLCNNVKGDRTADEWEEFMKENPSWWTIDAADARRRMRRKKRPARMYRDPADGPSTPLADALKPLKEDRP
jgi:hypothetical protein